MSESLPPAHSTSSRHAISVLIATAAILWNLVAITRGSTAGLQWNDYEMFVWRGYASAQVAVAGAYLAWGRWNMAIRAIVLVAAVLASCVISTALIAYPPRIFLAVYLLTAVATAVPLYVLRLAGLHLTHPDDPSAKLRRQYTLWDAFSLTTTVAILLGVMRWVDLPRNGIWEIVVLAATGSSKGVICVIIPLMFQAQWRAAMIAVVATLTAIWITSPFWPMTATMTHCIVVLATVWLLRLTGYRLVRSTSISTCDSPAPPHTTARPDT